MTDQKSLWRMKKDELIGEVNKLQEELVYYKICMIKHTNQRYDEWKEDIENSVITELKEENEKLEEENKKLNEERKKFCKIYCEGVNEQIAVRDEFEEENKKLKEENEHLRFVHKKTVEELDATKDKLINK